MKSGLFVSALRVAGLLFMCTELLFVSSCSTVGRETAPADERVTTSAVASWYGHDFHGRPTSSGEIFNMYASTCAHREYPFGTRLQVTNTTNRRSAQCIVNDRGPFVEGRDIDLSYAVARDIGIIGPGTGRVLLEVHGRDASYVRKVKVQAAERKGPFAIQVGAFTEGANAVRLKKALALKYNNVYILESEVRGTLFYRVRIGNYDSITDALSMAEKLGEEGYGTVILKADVKI